MNEFFYKYRRYFILFGSILIQLSIGNYYSFGNIENHVVHFMNNLSNHHKNVTTYWVFGSIVLGMGSSMTLGGYIEMKIGPSLTVLISGWLLSLIISLMYYTLQTNMSVIIVTYGLLGGMATGIAYAASLIVSLKNFPNNKGLIIGIVVSGFGLSASIFEPIQGAIYNDFRDNLPVSFLYIGIICAGFQMMGSILINEKIYERKNVTRKNDNESSEFNESVINEPKKYNETLELLPHQILWELDFWILWLILLLNAFCLTVFTAFSKRYWDEYYKNPLHPNMFRNISIIGSVFNGIGRIFWGILIDKKPFRIVNLIISLCISIFIGTFATITFVQKIFFPYIFGIWYSIIYFVLSGSLSVFPVMCAKLFGTKYFACNYGMLFASISAAATITSLIESSFEEPNIKILRNMFIISGSISFLSALLTLVFRGRSLISHSN